MPEINRFRRGDSFEKSRANESLFGASEFAEFLTYMVSLREGSRGEEVTAMGGWQWGTGVGMADWAWGTIDSSLRCAAFRMTCGGCVGCARGGRACGVAPADASYSWGTGDGSPHARGQRVGIGRPLGASLRGAEEGMGPRIREDNGSGMGSRIREDNGSGWGDGRFANRPYGRRILSGTGFTPIPRLHEGRL